MYRLKKCHGGIFYSGPYARLRHQSAVIIIVLGVLGKNVDISIDIDILDIDIDEAFLLSSRDHIEFSVSQVDWRILKKRRRSPRLWIGALSDEVR
jgi:hypothetical protein